MCSRSVGRVTGRTRCRSRRTYAGRRCPDHVPCKFFQKFFLTIHFLFENRSLVDFAIGNGDYGGDLEENGRFPKVNCILP